MPTEQEDQRYRSILTQHIIPLPDEQILEMRYNMGNEAWYIHTSKGWFYCDGRQGRSREWRSCPYGPGI